MNVRVLQGDVFDFPADALICPANPQLNLFGGVNGEILRRGGAAVQEELRTYLARGTARNMKPGTVVATTSGPLPYQRIIHAVAIDVFYETSVDVVTNTIVAAWELVNQLALTSISMPALATDYGRMAMDQFAIAFDNAVRQCAKLNLDVSLDIRDADDVALVRRIST